MIVDIYSRKIVGWEIHSREAGERASELIKRAVLSEKSIGRPLVLHADNGSPQKSSTLLTTLHNLEIEPSYSRPRVSDDNPYSESLFRTCKYRPDYPYKGFKDISEARIWVYSFVQWYNNEHRHRGIKFVTPAQRHSGQDKILLAKRKTVYEKAKARHPERWSGMTRNCLPTEEVWLNPNKQKKEENGQILKAA
jgi:transposase InsO family protein